MLVRICLAYGEVKVRLIRLGPHLVDPGLQSSGAGTNFSSGRSFPGFERALHTFVCLDALTSLGQGNYARLEFKDLDVPYVGQRT
jgi:hypothetical protein